MITLRDVKNKNGMWFGQSRFFGDISHDLMQSKSGKYFIVNKTYMFSDMFGDEKKISFRLHYVDSETLKIDGLDDRIFDTIDEVMAALNDM